MKKIVCIALALGLLLCAAGAWAAPFVNGKDVEIHKSSDWEWNSGNGSLTIKKSGLTVSDWGSKAYPAVGYISFSGLSGEDVEELSLTLENVHLQRYSSVINSDASSAATLRLTLNNSTLTCTEDHPAIYHNLAPNVASSLYVNGMDTTISGYQGIKCQSNYGSGAAPSASMYLSGSLTISGKEKAVECLESEHEVPEDGKIYIVGTEERAVIAECENDVERWALNKAKPYTATSEDIYEQIANAKVLWLKLVSDGVEDPTGPVSSEGVADLPHTGDSSRLALWGAMLAIALAGVALMKKRSEA